MQRPDRGGPATLTVLRAGPQDLIQDDGRVGLQRFGVSPSGALDQDAYLVALALAGSERGSAAIEFLHASGTYEVGGERHVMLAVAGAPGPVYVNGLALEANRSFRLAPGDRLRAGPRRQGQRGYITACGGIAVPHVLGSASTHLRGGFGGLHGRALAAGDVLPVGGEGLPTFERFLPDSAWPEERRCPEARDDAVVVRVMAGPQDDYFSAATLERFAASVYRVTKDADRMGYRLEGPPLEHAQGFNIVSDAIATGSVQVPGSGMPIVLLADRQTTGGFPKIATVIAADLPVLAQLGPGDLVQFRPVLREQAEAALRARRAWHKSLDEKLRPAVLPPSQMSPEYLLSQNLVTAYWEEA